MPDNRFFRITDEDVEELRDRTADVEMIDAYARWAKLAPQIDDLVSKIVDAFSGVELGDGIGLLEASGLDDYASDEERRRLRAEDEKTDWRRITVETLNRCYAAPSFLDARGFVFHLPAFLIAELNDRLNVGIIDHQIVEESFPEGWIELLTFAQRDAIVATLKLVSQHPEYAHRGEDIGAAIKRFGGQPITE